LQKLQGPAGHHRDLGIDELSEEDKLTVSRRERSSSSFRNRSSWRNSLPVKKESTSRLPGTIKGFKEIVERQARRHARTGIPHGRNNREAMDKRENPVPRPNSKCLKEPSDLTIVTPDAAIVHEQVDELEIPGAEGYLGVLPGHAPLFQN